jgi:predicted ATPase/DNA-binding CsgD family transcriptional regulator
MGEANAVTIETLYEPLTRREREMLGLLADGYSAPEMAERLMLALSTVKFHLGNLYGKLGVNNKRGALNHARALGLLSAPHSAVAGASLAADGPDPKPSATRKHNLPLQVTQFFGREAEIDNLQQRLAEGRLVTLTGPGGVGKTRLALRVAEACLDGFADGAWFVDLAPLTNEALVPQQVLTALGLHDVPGRPIVDTLTAHFLERSALLLLDNCEHVLAACAHLADSLLRACPRLRLLAASRESLGTAGEVVFVVPSLPFPPTGQPLSADAMAGYASVQLFVNRARQVHPGYEVAAHNAEAVASICQRLDGIPLALELAAARLRVLNSAVLAARLVDAFGVLGFGSRTAPPRQQTLRATIDWSYNLMSQKEQRLLERLAVFVGGCTLEAAEAVGAGDGLRASQILPTLGLLVEKSMVTAQRPPGAEPRYHLLETVRQYAQERMRSRGELEHLQQRHWVYFVRLAEAASAQWKSAEWPAGAEKMHADRANVRRALEWAFSGQADVDAGPRLVVSACFPWMYQETLDWYTRAVQWCEQHDNVSPQLVARLLHHASMPICQDDPPGALACARRSVEISRSLGPDDRKLLMECLFNLANICVDSGEAASASAPLAEAEALFEALGPGHFAPTAHLRMRTYIASQKAQLAMALEDYLAAKTHAGESIRLGAQAGDTSPPMGEWCIAGISSAGLGDYGGAEAWFRTVRQAAEKESEQTYMRHNMLAYAARWLADLAIRQHRLDAGHDYCRASLLEAKQIPDYNIIASDLGLLAAIYSKLEQPGPTARLSGASAALYARQKRKPWEDSSLDTLLPGWRQRADRAEIEAAFGAGQTMTGEQAIAYALDMAPAEA